MGSLTLPSPVLAFNFNDQFDLQGIVAAVDKANKPAILMLSERAIRFSGLNYLVNLFRAAQTESKSTLLLELDHSKDLELIDECLHLGFDIVMADFSDDDFDMNVLKTLQVVEVAHSAGVLVEAELGTVPSTKVALGVDRSGFTEPDLADQFVSRTNVDLLAISVGNLHGTSRQKPSPNFDLISELHHGIDVPLVLHGGDFYSNATIKHAFRAGIGKANFGPEIRAVYLEALLSGSRTIDTRTDDHRPILELARQSIEHQVSARLSALGASGRDSV